MASITGDGNLFITTSDHRRTRSTRLSDRNPIEEGEKSPSKSQKRPASEASSSRPNKKHKLHFNQTTLNLTQRISKAMKDVLVTTVDESFREKCLNTLGVDNGSDAGRKIEELIVEFKDNKKLTKSKKPLRKSRRKSMKIHHK